MELTLEQQDQFIEHVREGLNRQQAAEKIGETGTRFRFLCNRDPAFNRRFQEARVEGRGELTERLERCATELALGGHWPALKFMLTTYGEEFSWARSAKVEVQGSVEIQAIAGVLSRYLSADEYDNVIKAVEERMSADNQVALPPAA